MNSSHLRTSSLAALACTLRLSSTAAAALLHGNSCSSSRVSTAAATTALAPLSICCEVVTIVPEQQQTIFFFGAKRVRCTTSLAFLMLAMAFELVVHALPAALGHALSKRYVSGRRWRGTLR